MDETLIYRDENKPKLKVDGFVVRLDLPNELDTPYDEQVYVILHVENVHPDHHLVEIRKWHWFGDQSPNNGYNSENWHLLDRRTKVTEWLVEWELIEQRPIGGEDYEYFATESLMAQILDRLEV